MYINYDQSYISPEAQEIIKNGYGKLSVYSIHFDRHFTDEEKIQNRMQAERMTKTEYSNHCKKLGKIICARLKDVLQEVLKQGYDIHQVSAETSTLEHYSSDWDLFYWSNEGWNGEDYFDHFSLTFNKKRSVEQNMQLLEQLITLIEKMAYKNIGCRIQYDAELDNDRITVDAKASYRTIADKWITFNGVLGKIKYVESREEYGFFKKGTRSNYIRLSEYDVITKKGVELAKNKKKGEVA